MAAKQEEFRQELLSLGFDEVRFAASGRVPEEYRGRYLQWLEEGGQADMHWIDRSMEKRLDLNQVLPEAQSILLLGVNYLPDREEAREQERWAKYSLYRDYHDTIKPALAEAGRRLEVNFGLSGSDYRYYVDTGPVMERGWAARSGLGWQGKNGMLISREHGNWLFLAAIVMRFAFAADPPLRNARASPASAASEVGLLCGSCTRCIEACPTDAIIRPGIVDARRCISYQTIENKGIIPRDLRPGIGGRIYGCDICLDVCPWNRFAQAGRQVLLAERYDVASLSLPEILTLSREDFSRIFARTPIKRLKWRGLLRNACVVAGNLGCLPIPADKEEINALLPILVALASHEEPIVRAHAVWAVFRLAPNEAGLLLAHAREEESDQEVLVEYTESANATE
jgi:epoxyqueuosine reductase